MKKIDFRHYATERLSNFVFYVLIGIIVVLALLFRLVGFDMPYEYNFDYNAPVLTGVVVTFMLVLTGGTLLLMACTMIRGMRLNKDENRVVNNIPARRISVCVALGSLHRQFLVACFGHVCRNIAIYGCSCYCGCGVWCHTIHT